MDSLLKASLPLLRPSTNPKNIVCEGVRQLVFTVTGSSDNGLDYWSTIDDGVLCLEIDVSRYSSEYDYDDLK